MKSEDDLKDKTNPEDDYDEFDDERITTFEMMKKTYPFVIIRFLIIVVTIVPIATMTQFFAGFFFRLFGLEDAVDGIVYTVMWMNFAMIGCMVGLALWGFIRRTLLFYVKAAHVVAITKVCLKDDIKFSLTLESINAVRKQFLAVNIFYIADGLIKKMIDTIASALINQEIIPALNVNKKTTSLIGKIKSIGLKFMGSAVKTMISYFDEITLSYVYVQLELEKHRVEDSSKPGRKTTKAGKKRGAMKSYFKYSADAICLSLRNFGSLLKKSMLLVVQVTVFGWILSVLSVVVLVAIFGSGIVRTVIVFISIRIIFSLIMYVFIEPYETVTMITAFYYALTEESDTSKIQKQLLAAFPIFRKVFNKGEGEDDAESDVEAAATAGGPLLDIDIVKETSGIFRGSLVDSEDEDGSEDKTLDKNLESMENDGE